MDTRKLAKKFMDDSSFGFVVGTMTVAAFSIACSPAQRPFSTRAIDDPITPTEGMVELSVGLDKTYRERPRDDSRLDPSAFRLSYGLSNRLTFELLGLSYAVLEEQPLDDRPPARLSLRVGARLIGFGYSSLEGKVFLPTTFVEMSKRLSPRFWVSGTATSLLALRTRFDPVRDTLTTAGVSVGWQATCNWAVQVNP